MAIWTTWLHGWCLPPYLTPLFLVCQCSGVDGMANGWGVTVELKSPDAVSLALMHVDMLITRRTLEDVGVDLFMCCGARID